MSHVLLVNLIDNQNQTLKDWSQWVVSYNRIYDTSICYYFCGACYHVVVL
jgi:hypothetical protein